MSTPRISVVIPVHNGERYLSAAIESALAQRHRPHDLVVVDDGSTDESASIACRFGAPVRLLRQARRGASAARNAGVEATRGGYLAFLDADDLWTEQALACLLGALTSDPRLDLAFGHAREIVAADVDQDLGRWLTAREGLLPAHLVDSVLIRRGSFDRVGGFREDVESGEFLDWMARSRELGLRETLISEQVLWRRIHGDNHGIRRADARTDYARVLKSALDRRRAASEHESGAGA